MFPWNVCKSLGKVGEFDHDWRVATLKINAKTLGGKAKASRCKAKSKAVGFNPKDKNFGLKAKAQHAWWGHTFEWVIAAGGGIRINAWASSVTLFF